MCGPLQVYILICLISFIIQIHHTYTQRSWSWVNRNKISIFLGLLFNLVVFLFWGKVINSLCISNNKNIAWILIFAPLALSLFISALLIGGYLIEKVDHAV